MYFTVPDIMYFKRKIRKAETDHVLYKKAKKTFNKRCGKKNK